MKILNKAKTNIAKFVIVGMAAFAIMGTTATCIPQDVKAAETSTASQTFTDRIPLGELQEIIDNAKAAGALCIINKDYSHDIIRAGVRIRYTFEHAGTTVINWGNHDKFNSLFSSESQAKKYIKKMEVEDAEVCTKCINHFTKYYVVGNLPLIDLTYTIFQ